MCLLAHRLSITLSLVIAQTPMNERAELSTRALPTVELHDVRRRLAGKDGLQPRIPELKRMRFALDKLILEIVTEQRA